MSPGDDLAALIADALAHLGWRAQKGDIVVVCQKVVSKAEGRVRRLDDISPTPRATSLARNTGRDPRLVQAILDESRELLRSGPALICETLSGHICANAGIDASNAPADGVIVLLPEDPDDSARRLRAALSRSLGCRPGVVISDTFGRPWRLGQTDVAIGCAGLAPLDDWRGRADARRRPLTATVVAAADELAGAADLVRAKDGGQPVVAIRGLPHLVTPDDGPGARALLRPRSDDLFR